MKSKKKSKIIIISALGILFALSPVITVNLSFITGNNNKSSKYCDDINLDNENLKLSAISEKIHIDNNWTAAKAAGICTGNGTYSEPYVIEDWVIDGEYSESCILIENSNAYFKIENCTVTNSMSLNAGIKLYNVDNSQLIDNNCSSNYYGIHIYNGENNTVSGNTANYNGFGIYIRASNNNVSGNTANYNYHGIYIRASNNNILGNTANYNQYGIYIEASNNNILGNTANNNNLEGITLCISDYNTISGNTANYNGYGIYLITSNNNNISGNTANNNSYGIYLWKSNYNTVTENTLLGNDICIKEFYCTGNEFSDNGSCIPQGEGSIPGYNLFFILGILSVVAIILSKKMKKTIFLKTKNSKLF